MHIAICDDENTQLTQINNLLQEYSSLYPDMEINITTFSSGIELLEHLRLKHTFDIYLLDVIMPGENGIELGLGIREFDQAGHIIYFTTSPDFAIDAYRVKASDYLLKPPNKQRLFSALNAITERIHQEQQDYITIKVRDGLRRLPLHNIVYGELVKRCVQYNLADGTVLKSTSLRGSFQEAVKPLLHDQRFVLCTFSFFVNLSFIEMIESANLRLINGKILPLSRSFRTEVTQKWLDYHLERRK